MAEYGTYRIYNQLLDINPNSSIIKINEEQPQQPNEEENKQILPSKNDKVRKVFGNIWESF